MEVAANGQRVRFTRDIAAITMDLNDVESIVARTIGGADNLVVRDLAGTDIVSVTADLAAAGGGDDVLIGGPGSDTIDGGPGDNIVLDAFGANTVPSAAAA
jgi:Ca2+-binding RTX toxin-like protein